jgi:exodeoxyribonuclease V gamma subunit
LIANLQARQESPTIQLFVRPPIIVPNRSIETYLKYEFVRQAGVAAGLNFHSIETFLNTLLPKADPAPTLLNPTVLRAFFLDLLSEELTAAHTLPDEVRNYLELGGHDPHARDLRRYQLASRLAELAWRYGETRTDLLHTWDEDRGAYADGPLSSTEKWQRTLWTRLIGPEGIRNRAGAERGIQWILPWNLFSSPAKVDLDLPPEIHLFGFSYIWRGLREMIKHLNQRLAIHIYTVAPIIEFREDLTSLGLESKSGPRFSHRGSKNGSRAEQENAISPDDLPIVAHWSRPGREFFWMIDEIADTIFQPDFTFGQRTTVLGRLQRELLQRSPESDTPKEPDESLRILACPSIRREVEVIANEIWRLIEEDHDHSGSSPDRLRFPDVAVLLADGVNRAAYQAHFRAVFEDLHGIPFNMVDLPLAGECHVIEALLLLLALPLGEFTRPAVLKILTNPVVRAGFPEADTSQWREWCAELEIVHGADRSDHDGTYIDREVFHWEQGLRRLVLGTCMTGPRSGDERTFHLGDREYLPHDPEADALTSIARLLVVVRSLVTDVRAAQSARWTMTEWSAFFAGMVQAYLTAESDADARALSLCLQKIHDLQKSDVTGCKHGYRIASEILRKELQDLTGTRGHYLADGVVISPLLAMRSLPFRVVFLCGLGEGRFPASQGADPLDLTLARHDIGDVRPRERDKYLFLETLVCARERLYLSYVARDAQTGDDLEPSPVVHELLRYLHHGRKGTPAKFWVKKQPLRRYDQSYFLDKATAPKQRPVLANHSSAARREWQARELRKSLREHFEESSGLSPKSVRQLNQPLAQWLGLQTWNAEKTAVAQPERVLVSFRDLRRFLECPLQGWARLQLQLPEDDLEDEATREDEPFTIDRHRETVLLREVFLEALNQGLRNGDAASFAPLYDARVQSHIQRGLMPIGVFGDAERYRHLDYLSSWHKSAGNGGLLDRGRFSVYRFGRAGEAERVDRLESPIMITVPLTSRAAGLRTICVELFGRTEIVVPELPASITPVIRDKPRAKDFLAGFLDALILSMLPGHHESGAYHAYIITTGRDVALSESLRIFRGVDQARARAFLTTLLVDLLSEPHPYLLPCEAVFEYLGERQTPIRSSIERMKGSDFEACSSRYGPVPHFERYDPPEETTARQIVERRFSLFRDAGGITG